MKSDEEDVEVNYLAGKDIIMHISNKERQRWQSFFGNFAGNVLIYFLTFGSSKSKTFHNKRQSKHYRGNS